MAWRDGGLEVHRPAVVGVPTGIRPTSDPAIRTPSLLDLEGGLS